MLSGSLQRNSRHLMQLWCSYGYTETTPQSNVYTKRGVYARVYMYVHVHVCSRCLLAFTEFLSKHCQAVWRRHPLSMQTEVGAALTQVLFRVRVLDLFLLDVVYVGTVSALQAEASACCDSFCSTLQLETQRSAVSTQKRQIEHTLVRRKHTYIKYAVPVPLCQ